MIHFSKFPSPAEAEFFCSAAVATRRRQTDDFDLAGKTVTFNGSAVAFVAVGGKPLLTFAEVKSQIGVSAPTIAVIRTPDGYLGFEPLSGTSLTVTGTTDALASVGLAHPASTSAMVFGATGARVLITAYSLDQCHVIVWQD
jgi:hypothetical protein